MRLTASLQVVLKRWRSSLRGKAEALIDIGGAVFDDQGRVGGGFSEKITITAPHSKKAEAGQEFNYTYRFT